MKIFKEEDFQRLAVGSSAFDSHFTKAQIKELLNMVNPPELKQNKIKAYICTTDWNTELPVLKANDVNIYMNLKTFKKERTCWKECGIVEIHITKKRIVKKGTLL